MERFAKRTTRYLSLCVGLLLSSVPATHASAQSGGYPQRPIHFVVPYAPGGMTDVIARVTAEAVSRTIEQAVVIENRPGAGVTLASGIVAKAPGDGYTLLVTTLAHSINPSLFRKLAYDSDKDFEPVAMIGLVPLVLVVSPKLEARDLRSLIELLRKNPGKYSFGSAGMGSIMHVAPELFKVMTKTEAAHVPYKGEAPAINDIIGGHIAFAMPTLTASPPLIRSGALRPLAITSANRSAMLPDVPTMAEAGLPGFEAYTWTTLLAPASTPREIVDLLNRAVNRALSNVEVRARLTELGVEIHSGSTPKSTREFIRTETAKWAPIVKASGAVVD